MNALPSHGGGVPVLGPPSRRGVSEASKKFRGLWQLPGTSETPQQHMARPQCTNQCPVHSTFFTVSLEYICLYFAQF